MKVKIIVNPTAGKGQALKMIAQIKQTFEDSCHKFSLEQTTAPKAAIDIAKKAIIEDYDTVVAVGGDGTVLEVINGIAGSHVNLGIIPAGSGNDLARTLNIPFDLQEALAIITTFTPHIEKMDIGRVNGKYFANVAGIGFDTEVLKTLVQMKKIFSGTLAYILSVLKTLIYYKHKKVTLVLDGQTMEKEILLLAIANGKYYGGGMMIAPNADVTDGFFDVCIINKMPKWKILRLFPTIFKGTHINVPQVECFKAKEVTIVSENELVNCDGELIATTPITFSIVAEPINIIVIRSITRCQQANMSPQHALI